MSMSESEIAFPALHARAKSKINANLHREGALSELLWRAGDALYVFLRHCQYRGRGGPKDLQLHHLAVLLDEAERVAEMHLQQSGRVFSALTRTPWEKDLQVAIERELEPVLNPNDTLVMYPGVGRAKFRIGPHVPDIFLAGIPSQKANVPSRTGSGKKAKRSCIGIAIEVDGKVHDRQDKVAKDVGMEAHLIEHGIFTHRIGNDSISGKGMVERSALASITRLVQFGWPTPKEPRRRRKAIERLERDVSLRTIATFLTLQDVDSIIRIKLNEDLGLEGRYLALHAGGDHRCLVDQLSDRQSKTVHLLDQFPRRSLINQLNRLSLPLSLVMRRTL